MSRPRSALRHTLIAAAVAVSVASAALGCSSSGSESGTGGTSGAVTTTSTTPIPIDPAYNYFVGAPTQENATLNTTISPAFLVNGTNTIAVEIHQEVATSSDI